MSGSLTVIGGHTSTQGLAGLITVPSGFTGAVVTSLQSLLTSVSGAVSQGAANFENLYVAGQSGPQAATVGAYTRGVLDVTDYNAANATTTGTANVSLTVPSGYTAVVVQAPGSETITGSGGTGFLGVFSANSSVNFDFAGGSGTVFAAGSDSVALDGASGYFVGGAAGANSVSASGSGTASITLAGAANTVRAAAASTSIQAGGTSDLITTSMTTADSYITVTGHATIQNAGSADTVLATGSGNYKANFIGAAGGQLDFINSSSAASSIIANLNPVSGAISSQGSVTVSAGAGGGIYDGGISGNNSLVGGTGAVTLFSAGVNNYLFTNGVATGSAYNLLNAFSGGNDTLIAGSGSTSNIFFGGVGTESILSSGSGSQTYFVGTIGSETISASTTTGATNTFIFQQAVSQGGGTDVLLHFKPGEGYVNLGNNITNVKVLSFESLSGAHSGTQIDLTNGTTIKLIGVSTSSFNSSIIGGTSF